ncbi:MAG: alpha/beta hydrolase [Thermoleophilaceae bacterium]|nr:alpha/beta hydrolase [Thermoleophilaceae bacterium]
MSGPPDLPGVTHRDVRLRGIRLHVAEAGDGPPLLLLHGWPQHWWCWRRVIPRLAEQYRVIAPDLRGWGWSDAPAGDYAKRTFAEDMIGLLDHEEISRASVIGHDWGGYTAFLMALERPERIERLVALDISPPWTGPFRPRRLAAPVFASYQMLLATPRLGESVLRRRRFVPSIIRAGSGRGAVWSDAELDGYARVLSAPERARASSACYRTFLLKELPALSRSGDRLEVPTLLLMGGESPLRRILDPQPTRSMQVEYVPRAGHFLPEEAPGGVLARALPFLAAATP